MAPPASVKVEVEGRELTLTNLDKVLYPACGFTKADVISYYRAIAPFVLPHLRDRPITLKRYPNGVDEAMFFQKNVPAARPEWVRVVDVPIGHGSTVLHAATIDDLATLVWVANLAGLELHPLLSTAADLTTPTVLAFDLDPGPGADLTTCSRVGLLIQEVLEPLDVHLCPKTSGSKGMQLYAPLAPPVSFDQTKSFAKAVAQLLERRHPELITSSMSKNVRHGRIFIDWSQNDAAKTTVAAYSLRAMSEPTVSTPLRWDEVRDCARGTTPLRFTAADVLARVERDGDLFAAAATGGAGGAGAVLPDLGR